MISEQQMKMHDYDWFCCINDFPVCVSSAGSPIPEVINRDNYILNSINRASRLPRVCGFNLNTIYLVQNVVTKGFEYLSTPNSAYAEVLRPQDVQFPNGTPIAVQYYAEYFAKIAERGFWVFDRDILYTEGYRFHLVAWPRDSKRATLLHSRMFSDYMVNLHTPYMNFKEPERLVELNLLDYFVEDHIRIEEHRI